MKLKCKTCGAEGDCDGTINECVNCWEVERRLEKYLESRKGKKFVINLLKNMELSNEKYHITILEIKK